MGGGGGGRNVSFSKNFAYVLRIWSHLLEKSLMENVNFCAVSGSKRETFFKYFLRKC